MRAYLAAIGREERARFGALLQLVYVGGQCDAKAVAKLGKRLSR